ncbi:hypothetical protein Rsub_03582 [Raphidocelis subcapitata]|uniref:Peptidase S1 domain-containing protein n=1 Tax=Raphidocelis subcapitata TaxID=307507 RepID=A0A2V0NX59_9CHLO|nr:hypothetical protein Rsub_03582 [Raphidocelis subcapitata]|eukprot:GBF91262.1 hypothetical protein Rsub_03582 [Raphidocelis subcapitata]
MAPPVMKSRAALAVAAALALLLACAAPSAAQGSGDFSANDQPPSGQPAAADASAKFSTAKVVHTKPFTKAAMKRATQERAVELTAEQAAALIAAAANTPAAAEEAGVESAASYAPESGGVVPLSQGTSGFSFADTRVAKTGTAFVPNLKPAGKLFFKIGTSNYICSASLIGKSLAVTAAHCVCAFGKSTFYTDFTFVPDYDVDNPSGNVVFRGKAVIVATSYLKGTDTCATAGVACSNDVALVWLDVNNGQQAFQAAGNTYYNYMINAFEASAAPGAGFASAAVPKYLAVTQLGYPGNWDNGGKMQMSNSPGFQYNVAVSGKTMKNIVRGTSMTGGSSGGPWLLNLGVDAAASNGANYGSVTTRNAVIAVTSWGRTDAAVKFQGASMFATNNEFPNAAYGIRGGGNIGALVDYACDSAGGWGLQAKGFCR